MVSRSPKCHSPYFRSDLLRRVSDISDISDNLRPFTIHLLVLAPTLALYSALCSITPPLLWLPSTYSIATPTLTITYSIYSVLTTTINKSYLAMYFSSLNIDVFNSSLVSGLLTATLLWPHLQLHFRHPRHVPLFLIIWPTLRGKYCHIPYFRSDILRRIPDISDTSDHLRPHY